LKRENDLQIRQFLEQHENAALVENSVDWGTPLDCGRQIMPGEAQMDGFFYAVLRKIA
jgi:16S rRNA (cytosine967-C5)-methyltransferase